MRDQLVDVAGSVQQRIIRVQVQMRELCGHALSLSLGVRQAVQNRGETAEEELSSGTRKAA
jgi:hypothetical protein